MSVELSNVIPPFKADTPRTVTFPSVPRLVSDEAVTPTPRPEAERTSVPLILYVEPVERLAEPATSSLNAGVVVPTPKDVYKRQIIGHMQFRHLLVL